MTAEKITYLQLRRHVMCVCFVDHFSGRFEPHRFERLTNKPTPEEMPQNLNANSVSGIDNWLKLSSFIQGTYNKLIGNYTQPRLRNCHEPVTKDRQPTPNCK